jgi:hypothetical protein
MGTWFDNTRSRCRGDDYA